MRAEDIKMFVTLWYECDTFQGFLARVEMDARAASNLAADLRRKGVELTPHPKCPRKPARFIDADELDMLKRWAQACKAARAMKILKQKEAINAHV